MTDCEKKVIVVGGVAGGATAAARLRRLDEHAEITIYEQGNYVSYANCGLPYHIGGVIPERNKLLVQTPESLKNRYNLNVKVNHTVTAIDTAAKTVTVVDNTVTPPKESVVPYDKLILSPGASPIRPRVPGFDLPCVYTLRSVPDTDAIKAACAKALESPEKRAVVIGAGFIGLEMADNLVRLGLKVTIVEKLPQVMSPVDYPIACIVQRELRSKGVELYLGDGVKEIVKGEEGKGVNVVLESGASIAGAGVVILSIGVSPNTALAKAAGLRVEQGIVVDEYLRTSDPNIYAIGDAIQFPHPLTGKPYCCYLAGPANKQARICADNIALDNSVRYKGSIATGIAHILDLTVASAGLNEANLRRNNMAFQTVITHGNTHAGYYPDSKPMVIKLNFDPESGKLYGGQVVAADGVDARIDMISSVIGCGGTVTDLTDIEHAYAPPFSGPKDPVALTGYAAENIVTKKVFPIQWHELRAKLADPKEASELFIIDARTETEVKNTGIIGDAHHFCLDGGLREAISKGLIPKDKQIVVYCMSAQRSYISCRILMQCGYPHPLNLVGSWKTYSVCDAEMKLLEKK